MLSGVLQVHADQLNGVTEQHASVDNDIATIQESIAYLTKGLGDTRMICDWQGAELEEIKAHTGGHG
ncbi:hypothetical protein DAKH74_037940 [Maudiozyma humilis]|uniref:Uncharacterized protein n=1 Tax=Maudiozyma humilis TaxID=51915 RepID=A0AAV5S2R6_MAUHU|nr:hypothetical protein DAKH74_037940 [Kazachstania humilis]